MLSINDLLTKYGLEYKDLTPEEEETLHKWSEALSGRSLSLPDIKDYLDSMIESVEREISGYETPVGIVAWMYRRKRSKHLHARLYNYLMLRDFCSAPEKAQKYVETQLSQLANSK